MVQDLHILLSKAGIAGPFVFVGHSLGGMNIRLYASQYPDEVAGLVLVDSALEDVDSREEKELLPPVSANESKSLKDERQFLVDDKDPTKNPENVDQEASKAQVRSIKSLGSVPLIVIAHGKPFPEVPSEIASQYEQLWQSLQKDLTKLSSNSSIMIAKNSGHLVSDEQPEIIIDAIHQMVDKVRK